MFLFFRHMLPIFCFVPTVPAVRLLAFNEIIAVFHEILLRVLIFTQPNLEVLAVWVPVPPHCHVTAFAIVTVHHVINGASWQPAIPTPPTYLHIRELVILVLAV